MQAAFSKLSFRSRNTVKIWFWVPKITWMYVCCFSKIFSSGKRVGHWVPGVLVCTKWYRATFVWPWKSVPNFLFHGQIFGAIKTKLLLILAKETPNMGSKQFDCPITLLHFKWRQSETFQKVPGSDDVVRARLFLFDEPSFLFTFIFQGHTNVALSWLHESVLTTSRLLSCSWVNKLWLEYDYAYERASKGGFPL